MKKAKLIALLLCVVLACVGVFALTGCNGGGGTGSGAEQQVLLADVREQSLHRGKRQRGAVRRNVRQQQRFRLDRRLREIRDRLPVGERNRGQRQQKRKNVYDDAFEYFHSAASSQSSPAVPVWGLFDCIVVMPMIDYHGHFYKRLHLQCTAF